MRRPAAGTDVVHPSLEDPALRSASAFWGGPAGEHGRGHRWWTPVRVLLVITAVVCALGMLQKAGCAHDDWRNGNERYAQMCYSDLPYLYTARGFAEREWPYSSDRQTRARYDVMEYPAGIAYFAWGTALVTQVFSGWPDVEARADRPVSEVSADPEVVTETRIFVVLSALSFALLSMLTAWLLAGVHPRRPWDALGFAAAPTLLLTGLINWDLLAVAMVAGALWAWARDRPVLTGALIGVGCATKLYPLFLLGGLLVICLRQRRMVDFGQAAVAAALAWLLVNAPAMVTGLDQWKVFWTFNSDRGPDLGSVWLVLQESDLLDASPHLINLSSWIFFGLWCAVVLAVGLKAPVTPRLAQLGFLIVVGFLLVNKVYSPQYVLWLLPLAALARPRWRDLMIWQAGEILYFCCVWWYLGGYLAGSTNDGAAGAYWIAVAVRIVAELYLAGVIVRDLYSPRHDPVRATLEATAGG